MKSTIKFLIISIVFLSGLKLFGQTLNYMDLTSEKPKGRFSEYISKDGSSYKVGDTLTVGKGSGANGDFVFIDIMTNMANVYHLAATSTSTKTILKSMVISGNKKAGWKINCTSISGRGNTLYFSLEDAIANGEIKSFGMTSDEALAELKRCKDKLELGVITQEEFDKKKAELIKYIK